MDEAIKRRLENFESAHHQAAGDVDTNKVNAYAAGLQRKSKRDREKDTAEAKRLQEEEDAARAYKDFVASFEGPDDAPNADSGMPSAPRGLKTFVRAGGSGPATPIGTSSVSSSGATPTAPRSGLTPIPTGPRGFKGGSPAHTSSANTHEGVPTGPRSALGGSRPQPFQNQNQAHTLSALL
ncbi:MAG: hypothetical protein CYPHOPRED_002316 [Cyphobasidiales sp. Tagirdzhanova-0007]|nr:MAG: hypothetical protein CYPHOPRED_002316 [Cyphobasidiales sp. Tagirdzhanova-0007]